MMHQLTFFFLFFIVNDDVLPVSIVTSFYEGRSIEKEKLCLNLKPSYTPVILETGFSFLIIPVDLIYSR